MSQETCPITDCPFCAKEKRQKEVELAKLMFEKIEQYIVEPVEEKMTWRKV